MPITEEQVHAAADAIAAHGERPTLTRVRRELGGGSFSTISEAMAVWREKQTEEHQLAHVAVPDEIAERAQQLGAAVWSAAMQESERRLQAERDALAEAQEAAAAETKEAQEAVQVLEAELSERDQRIEALTTERDQLREHRDALDQQVRERDTALARAEQRAADAERYNEALEAQRKEAVERADRLERLIGERLGGSGDPTHKQ